MAMQTSEMMGRIDPAQSFDTDALLRYAMANVDGFPQPISESKVSQFRHGQSNPTFLMEAHSGSVRKRYVIREKPPGKLLESVHAVEREFQVLHALGIHSLVPVPKVYCLCADSSIIGTSFYIMEYLEGCIYVDPKLPGVEPKQRRALCKATAKVLTSLHSVDVDAIGLHSYGKGTTTVKDRNPRMLDLIDWLRQHIPLDDFSGTAVGLVHGDFRIDNLVFHPTQDRVIGILDWELSTLGNQMCDVAYSCLHYVVDISLDKLREHEGLESTGMSDGIPSLAEYLAYCCAAAGKPWPASQWNFYIAFSLFRGASIHAGVHCRWILGNASGGERARHPGQKGDAMVEIAWAFIDRGSVIPQYPPESVDRELSQQLGKEKKDSPCSSGGRFVPNQKVQELRNRLIRFMEDHIYPMEHKFYELAQSDIRWSFHPEEERLKELAKKEGLWNLWIPVDGES